MNTFKIILPLIIGLCLWAACERHKDIDRPVDGDGNEYSTIIIGTQEWLTENLKTTKYCGGAPISLVTDNKKWEDCKVAAYCWYDNDIAYKNIYGGLYNFHTVNIGVLCPLGYHVPTIDEWTTLANYMKDAPESVKNSFNSYYFGFREWNGSFFEGMGCWWASSTDGSSTNVRPDFSFGAMPKNTGYSVRCIRDN